MTAAKAPAWRPLWGRSRSPHLVLVSVLSLGSFACGSDGTESPASSEGPETGIETPVSPTVDPAETGVPSGGTPAVGNAYDEEWARCNLSTDWAGDELCLVAPDPSEGFQLRYGPTDYDDPDAVEWFINLPGEETNDSLPMTTPNTTEIFFNEFHTRLRPGTHHLILWTNEGGTGGFSRRFLLGAQAALGEGGGRRDMPPVDEPLPPENEGLAYRIGPTIAVDFNLHYVNATDEPLLREGWVNFHYATPDEVGQVVDPITFFGAMGLNVPPHATKIEDANCAAPPVPVRILSLTGHMHSHGVRFSVWHNSSAGRELIYETFEWSEPGELFYDTAHANSPPDPATLSTGGYDGILTVNPGDSIDYECEFVNDLDTALTFGNEAYTAEMCLLFGTYTPSTGAAWGCFSP